MIELWSNYKDFIYPLFVGLVFTIAGLYKNIKIDTIRRDGIKVAGEIVNYKAEVSYSLDRIRTYYHPVIRFTDNKGTERQIVDSTGSYPKPNKKLPFKLNVYYIQNNGDFEMVTDDKLTDIVSMSILVIGLVTIVVTLFFFFMNKT